VTPPPEVVRIEAVLTSGSGMPCVAACDDGRRRVVKLRGAGGGAAGLLVEALGLRVARAFGAPVPEACVVTVPQDLPWTAGTDEFDALLQRSWGANLGIAYVAEARTAGPEDVASAPGAHVAAIASADRFLANVDRTARNPNLLASPGGGIVAIDYGACLIVSRALSGRLGGTTLPRGHLLPDAARLPIPALPWADMTADLPDTWFVASGTDRPALVAALGAYEAAARGAWA
jgi:hypothetical protein